MPRFQSSFALSPHKTSLCFLLYEVYQSPLLSLIKQQAIFKYILGEQADSALAEKSLANLKGDL